MLHLIRPLGFELDNKKLRRAGLDYREFADVQVHDSLDQCLDALKRPRVLAISTHGTTLYSDYDALKRPRVLAISTHGTTLYSDYRFEPGDTLLLGPETRGLPDAILQSMDPAHVLRVPMRPQSRSLNLSNAAAVVLYEAWRQQGFSTGG